MKWLLWGIALYEGVVGAAEIFVDNSSTSVAALNSIVSAPTVGSLVQPGQGTTSGVIDLGVAALVYWFGIL